MEISKKIKPAMLIRYLILGILLIYISFVGYMHQKYEVRFPSVDAICPFGGLESLYSIIFQGKFLHRVLSSSLILLGIITVITIFSGRSFCGWICPLGTLQGIMSGFGKRHLRSNNSLKKLTDINIRWFRYVILFLFTIGAWYGGKLLIRPYDPWVAWMHISEFTHTIEEFPIGMVMLLIVLLISLFIPRTFCRYLCPMGAFLSLVNKLSLNKIQRNSETCTQCGLCDKTCPVGLEVSQSETVERSECISCGECASVCPVPKTLDFHLAGKWKLHSLSLGLIVIVVFFGTITAASWKGIYSSTPPSITEYKESNQFKPEMIKGYMTLREVAFLFDLDLSVLYEQLDLDPKVVPADTKCKEIEEILDEKFDTDVVRVGVGTLLNVPADKIEKSCTPDASSPGFIYGTMTLAQVSDQFNIPLETLYSHLELSMERIPPNTQCRDLKNLVDPTFHTSRVRQIVDRILR
ncbi:4Fe-4S binding protein [Thermodesulfobacteriota bacterium]